LAKKDLPGFYDALVRTIRPTALKTLVKAADKALREGYEYEPPSYVQLHALAHGKAIV
jgi:hypothetical protein